VIINKPGKLFFISFLLAALLRQVGAQPLNYSEIFGDDWQKAIGFLETNNHWLKPALEKYNIPYSTAIAIVIPELVRYSALRDKMEITLLKTLYRNLGDDYADFSVGVFQIKPSFAEKIREEAYAIMGNKARAFFKKPSSYKEIRLYRASIISDLEDPEKEFNYIIAFLKICESRFKTGFPDEETKIRFLAPAYNTGFWKSVEEIEKMSDLKFFNTKLFKTENYSYADVSLFWYRKYFRSSAKYF
jgi:hypothetical protein